MTPKEKQRFIDLIKEIQTLMNWEIALDDQPGHAMVQGVILGTPAFLERVDLACKAASGREGNDG